jgi:transcriptional regulator with XRE-family HTH domain
MQNEFTQPKNNWTEERETADRLTPRAWLIALRVRKGLSQEALARRMNVSLSSVQKWEAGRVVPSASREALALHLGEGDEVLDRFHAEDRKHLAARRAQELAEAPASGAA